MFVTRPDDVLSFDLSLNTPKFSNLIIENTSNTRIAYKIRTNASKSFIVKPSQGYLNPNETVSITITIQLPELQQEIKHKFMIVGTNATNCEDLAF